MRPGAQSGWKIRGFLQKPRHILVCAGDVVRPMERNELVDGVDDAAGDGFKYQRGLRASEPDVTE